MDLRLGEGGRDTAFGQALGLEPSVGKAGFGTHWVFLGVAVGGWRAGVR